jgi:GNAT superfamily N-acetyltransferase
VTVRPAVSGILRHCGPGLILVIRSKAQVVGMAILAFCWTVEHGGRSVRLDELYVLEDYRGNGLGQCLLAAAVRESQRLGRAAIDLEADEEHGRVERLCMRKGSRRLARRSWVLPLRRPAAMSRPRASSLNLSERTDLPQTT